MAIGTSDVSWSVLRQVVRDWAGTSAELEEVRPLHGGAISVTLGLFLRDGQKAVIKITPHRVDKTYADEAAQLELLRAAGLPVPRVYHCHPGSLDRPFSYLLIEFIEGVDLSAAKAACDAAAYDGLQAELAEVVLKLHEQTHSHYMRVTCQPEGDRKLYADWPTFYREVYDPVWREADKLNALPPKCRKQVAKIHERLGGLVGHDDRPRLVHWDLWSTNILARPDAAGRWRVSGLLDPCCKYAHAEAEIAYLELFHTVTPAFMKAYQHVHRMPPDYHRVRRPVYHLYGLLNDLALFGHGYVNPVIAAVDKLNGVV